MTIPYLTILNPSPRFAGRFINGTAVTTLCAQILFDDKTASMQNDVLLWKEVPANLTQRLDTADKSFRPCN